MASRGQTSISFYEYNLPMCYANQPDSMATVLCVHFHFMPTFICQLHKMLTCCGVFIFSSIFLCLNTVYGDIKMQFSHKCMCVRMCVCARVCMYCTHENNEKGSVHLTIGIVLATRNKPRILHKTTIEQGIFYCLFKLINN